MGEPTDRWREVDALFQAALDLRPEQRAAFLKQTCQGDAGLRAAVQKLLAAGDEARTFLETSVDEVMRPLWEGLAGELDAGGSALEGTRVGAYRLVRQLARGGMGNVYLAERADEQFEQQVAVKILRRGLDTEDIVRRFLAERQILASLNHPNIAQLLDGGATEDGRPYLVMEYVEGQPIDAYCDGRRLTLEERLQLFLTVARAVGHAHRHLVVHRDVKPSNVFATHDGTVKLLDFGIAKLLDETVAPEISPITRTGLRLMTPGYASPEQVRGDPITTASDIYQLGLLLYELLTGHRAQRIRHASQREIERVVCEEDPVRPSQVVAETWQTTAGARAARVEPAQVSAARGTDPGGLARALRGDLDTIVMTALRKETERRYASVEQLAEDIERHLTHRPLLASKETVAYRVKKFVRRHPFGVAAAAGFVLLLAAYGVTATVLAQRLAAERDRAEIHAAKAEQVRDFMVGMFETADPNVEARGDTITVRDVLDAGVERARQQLADQPEIQAELLRTIGGAYGALGRNADAVAMFEEALETRRELYGPVHEEVAEALRLLAVFLKRIDPARALEVNEEGLEVATHVYGPGYPYIARLLADRADMLTVSDVQRAAALYDSALTILRSYQDHDYPEENYKWDLAQTLSGLADYRPTEEAIPLELEALQLRKDLYGEKHLAVAASLNDVAAKLRHIDPDSAERLYRRAIAMNTELLGRFHFRTLEYLNNLAVLYREDGRYTEAETVYRELVDLWTTHHPDNRIRAIYAKHGLGWVLSESGRAEEAEPLLREVVDFLEADPEVYAVILAIGQSTLGRCLALQGRYPEAERLLLESYEVVPNYPETLNRLVRLYEDWGRPEQAEPYRQEASTG